MKVLYSNGPIFSYGEKSIFLVGPTPRSSSVPSWRPEALRLLEEFGFDGSVLVPERSDGKAMDHYDDQVRWELAGLSDCTVIAAWVPRDLDTMPALTTNVEFGFWLAKTPARLLYGRPNVSPKNRYLDYLYREYGGKHPAVRLEDLLQQAIDLAERIHAHVQNLDNR